ncbi:hypothetical protein MOC47_21430 [Bacillus spizizenii]|uniref:hypothetical protein n=1 Tax=Bacillus spizizenii TaxID=96241 RepID=UPI000AAB2716|nr:hypothetical protein [Bacillus spizizenii]MCY8042071.1 hypothetical protein [Bacillus spizizenii]MCY8331320.1 hypothetical protein [Bacillus spizizenii]
MNSLMKVKQLTSSCKSLYGNLGLTEMAAMNWHTISDNILKFKVCQASVLHTKSEQAGG